MRRCHTLLLVLTLLSLVGCDHATKYVAKAELEAQPAHVVVDSIVNLRYVENRDVAFNLLSFIPEHVRFPLLLLTGAAAIGVLVALFASGRVRGWALGGLVLFLAGALGNYLDRLVRGYVVDFIHVAYWPVFNVADVLVTLGLGLIVLQSMRPKLSAPAAPSG